MEEDLAKARTSSRLAWAGLAVAVLAVIVRFGVVARAALSYDEATYVEMARHPWTSSYYPDQLFLRHPPFYFVLMWAWTALVGTSELAVRVPSFMAALGGIGLTWMSARRVGGDHAAALAGAALALSFLVLVYAVQATMYPIAFALIALGLWAHVTGRARLETTAVAILPLVHLFGFLIAAVWWWQNRLARPSSRWILLPGAAWVLLAGIAAFITRAPAGPSLGPTWQALRLLAVVYEAFATADGLVLHVLAVVLAVLMLGPVFLWQGWRRRATWTPWGWAGAVLVIALIPGPGFLRYALLAAPIVLVAAAMPGRAMTPRLVAAALVFAVLSGAAGAAYVTGGVDQRAGNDIPGLVDWREVAKGVASHHPASVITPAPTALAYYLGLVAGATIVDASAGPGRLMLSTPGGPLELVEMPHEAALAEAGLGGGMIVLPDAWGTVRTTLDASGYLVCLHVTGASLLRAADTACRTPSAYAPDA